MWRAWHMRVGPTRRNGSTSVHMVQIRVAPAFFAWSPGRFLLMVVFRGVSEFDKAFHVSTPTATCPLVQSRSFTPLCCRCFCLAESLTRLQSPSARLYDKALYLSCRAVVQARVPAFGLRLHKQASRERKRETSQNGSDALAGSRKRASMEVAWGKRLLAQGSDSLSQGRCLVVALRHACCRQARAAWSPCPRH